MSGHALHALLALVLSLMALPATPGSDAAGWTAYVDPTQGFSIGYPNGFAVEPQDLSKSAQFTPMPIASILFMNPTMAGGDLAGIEPPDLAVRVYRAGAVDSLQGWLVSVGLASAGEGAVTRPWRNASVSGLKVCRATMIASGCSRQRPRVPADPHLGGRRGDDRDVCAACS